MTVQGGDRRIITLPQTVIQQSTNGVSIKALQGMNGQTDTDTQTHTKVLCGQTKYHVLTLHTHIDDIYIYLHIHIHESKKEGLVWETGKRKGESTVGRWSSLLYVFS